MSEDRPVDDPYAAIAELRARVEDLATTTAARIPRRPTGDIEWTFRNTAKDGCLFLRGQTVTRAAYPALWAWVQEQSLAPAVFGVGDGSTTFVLPDTRGRVPRGKPDAEAIGLLVGSDTVTLTAAQIPGHVHPMAQDGQHQHGFLTAQGGDHGGHFPTGQTFAPDGADVFGLAAWNSSGSGSGTHNHSGTTAYNTETHDHGGTGANTGGGQAHENRQASINVNCMIWC